MISFKQYINEIFDTPAPFTIKTTRGISKTKFTAGYLKFEAVIERTKMSTTNNVHQIYYGVEDENIGDWVSYSRHDKKHRFRSVKIPTLKVFATLLAFVEETFKTYPLVSGDIITFEPYDKEDNSQTKLYKAFGAQLAKRYNGVFTYDPKYKLMHDAMVIEIQ